MRALLLATAATLCLGLVTWADAPTTTLRVEVKTLNDKPVDRASVIVKFVRGRSIVKLGKQQVTQWQMKTNQEGIAKIPPIPQGEILIQVIAKGYQTYGDRVEVNEPEKTIEVKLNPPQPQYSVHK
jgi:hypothetical protein